jgi:gamma-glutamyltranspeptidase/glutathione hydrolase
MRDLQLPGRSAVHATHAMAATSHPAATLVAIETLHAGGNAIDAAIAAAATLAVVEPHSTGIGGDVFALYQPKSEGELIALNGSGRAPAAATAERLKAEGLQEIGFRSPHAVTVPGAVAAWQTLSDDHGRLGLDRLLRPAIAFARDGYPVHEVVAHVWAREYDKLAADANARAVFLATNRPLKAGEIHRQPALADTLEAIADGGRDAFYTGGIAQDMVACLQGLGGLHTMDDFAGARADYVAPIHTDYDGLEVWECPPNGQGIIALMMLNILSGFELAKLDPLGAERIHLEAEATRLAYRDRAALIADPEHAAVPVETLLSDDYADGLRALISPDRALEHMPPPGEAPHRDTVYLTVVDADRNAVSFINSLFHSYGTGLMSPKTGVMFHNRGSGFSLDPAHPNCIAPGKRPMHTIIPGMAMKGGRAQMPFGVMGGHFQPVGHVHFLTNLVDYGMSVQEALDCPRAFAFGDELRLEHGVPEATRAKLAAMGHRVVESGIPLGGGQAIWIDWDTGVLTGGSDPRKDGCALGY